MHNLVCRGNSKRVLGFLCLFTALLQLGCGSSGGGAKTEVTGKVTLGDKPVAGIVTFVSSDGKETSAPISADGTYTIIDPPLGATKIYVKPVPGAGAAAPPKMPKGGPDMPTDGPKAETGGVAPPQKFTTPASSGLTYEVKAGKQTFDIPLK